MSYKSAERDNAILNIAPSHPDVKGITLYENLTLINRITIT